MERWVSIDVKPLADNDFAHTVLRGGPASVSQPGRFPRVFHNVSGIHP